MFSALFAAAAAAAAIEPPYEAVKRGLDCNLRPDGSLGCRYRVGRDLEFELHRVGEPGVMLRLLRASDQGDYSADPKLLGRCVFVRHGTRGREAGGSEFYFAFVSAMNGFVYRSLRDCRLAR
ncbi:MAG: hypothetical protein OEZ09_07910 [Betaproteobacteria bacterium]|nr:hypothetical protein [Betaproteobacteria bacterium]MDH4324072.1 hypothetical protein [Betaproteobacteria bacterium]MDH5211635.1 hypothetical protein [Betaproteobacteria bacterium]MDH5578371.1 hypothetical protein [Betaproteobacteria bacterium]